MMILMKRITFCNLYAYEIYGDSAQSTLEDGNNFFILQQKMHIQLQFLSMKAS